MFVPGVKEQVGKQGKFVCPGYTSWQKNRANVCAQGTNIGRKHGKWFFSGYTIWLKKKEKKKKEKGANVCAQGAQTGRKI